MSHEYQAYLIRFERSNMQASWRVRVENAETGEILHFATEWELFRFLMATLSKTAVSEHDLGFVPPDSASSHGYQARR